MAKRSLKTVLAIAASVTLLAGVFAGCGGNDSSSAAASEAASSDASSGSSDSADSSSTASTEASGDKIKIGYANRKAADVYLKTLQDKFVEAAEADGRYEVILADANNDSQKQVSQVENFLVMGVDVLVLCPNDEESLVPLIDQANAEGIPVFTMSVNASGDGHTHIGVSDLDCGLKQGEWMYENLPENAKVVYISGNMGYQISIDRKEGLLEGLGDRLKENGGDIEIIAEQECMYTRDDGMRIMEDYIQALDDFDCVVAVNDLSACGAIEALKAANRLDGVAVCGIDAIDDALAYIKNGEMAMTARQDPDEQVAQLLNAIGEVLDGKDVGKNIKVQPQTVTADNVDEFLN